MNGLFKKIGISALVVTLCVVLIATGVLLAGLQEKFSIADYHAAAVRNIGAEELSQCSVAEKTEALVKEFRTYSSNNSESGLEFIGELPVKLGELTGFDNLSVTNPEELKKVYSGKFEEDTFTVTIRYVDAKNNVIKEVSQSVEPFYDGETEDVLFCLDNEIFSVTDLMETEPVENCLFAELFGLFGVALAAFATVVAAAMTVTVSVCAPTMIETPTVGPFGIVVICQLLNNLGLHYFAQKVLEDYLSSMTYEKCPTISISGVGTVVMEAIKEENMRKKPMGKYFAVFFDPSNQKFYISPQAISRLAAVSIMRTPVASVCMASDRKQMVLSIYTTLQSDAYDVAAEAGIDPSTPLENPCPDGLHHYHSRNSILIDIHAGDQRERRPHAFFGFKNFERF